MNKIKQLAIFWVHGLYTGQVLTDYTKDDIKAEMENIPSTDDQEFREMVKTVLVEMTAEDRLPSDMTDLCIDTVFEEAENRLYGYIDVSHIDFDDEES